MTKEEKRSEYRKQYRLDNKEKIAAYRKQWRLDNKEKAKEYDRQYHLDNQEKIAKKNKQWKIDNPENCRATAAKRRASKLQRTVGWSDYLVIQMIYQDCPEGMEVDHIIPLQGKNVSGLHVAWNLQYLTPKENQEKGNKYDISA